jgi:hypothetical protein
VGCELTHDTWKAGSEYEVLSYAWGNGDVKKTIKLNGESFSVTENLYYALSHIRYKDRVRTLWIDDMLQEKIFALVCTYSTSINPEQLLPGSSRFSHDFGYSTGLTGNNVWYSPPSASINQVSRFSELVSLLRTVSWVGEPYELLAKDVSRVQLFSNS